MHETRKGQSINHMGAWTEGLVMNGAPREEDPEVLTAAFYTC